MNSDPKAERIGAAKRKNKGRQSGKPSNPIPIPIRNTTPRRRGVVNACADYRKPH